MLNSTMPPSSTAAIAFSTFIAHVASDLFAYLLRHPDGKGFAAKLRHDLRDPGPIASNLMAQKVPLVLAELGIDADSKRGPEASGAEFSLA